MEHPALNELLNQVYVVPLGRSRGGAVTETVGGSCTRPQSVRHVAAGCGLARANLTHERISSDRDIAPNKDAPRVTYGLTLPKVQGPHEQHTPHAMPWWRRYAVLQHPEMH